LLAKLGYARDEVFGRPPSDLLTPESRERAANDVLPELFKNDQCNSVEYQMLCKDGCAIDVLLSAVLDRHHSDRGCISLWLAIDVTARRTLERQLVKSEAVYRGLIEDQSEIGLPRHARR
jgi:PAS domain S-box-containing protein